MRYTARFSNGTIATRNSQRDYSHAYLVVTRREFDGRVFDSKGFSKTRQLAEKERDYHARPSDGFTRLFAEVVPVEVSAK